MAQQKLNIGSWLMGQAQRRSLCFICNVFGLKPRLNLHRNVTLVQFSLQCQQKRTFSVNGLLFFRIRHCQNQQAGKMCFTPENKSLKYIFGLDNFE